MTPQPGPTIPFSAIETNEATITTTKPQPIPTTTMKTQRTAATTPKSRSRTTPSLLEADNCSLEGQQPPQTRWAKLKRFLSFCGPGYMIAVGYMDPGNWATDIEAGSKYGYNLLYVILLSTAMAVVLQHLCIRVGVYTRRDLAQNCRIHCGPALNVFLYVVAELAIISCDLSEVIGTAIALNLLFKLPILWGVVLTVADVLVLLAGFNSDSSRQYRALEALVMVLMSVVGVCFLVELVLVRPDWKAVALGFLPRSTELFTDKDALFSALGIIGATVMPHNLYLHSSIVKYRLPQPLSTFVSDDSDVEDDLDEEVGVADVAEADVEVADVAEADVVAATAPLQTTNQNDSETHEQLYWQSLKNIIKYNTLDTCIALFFALLINAAILIVSAAAFNARGKTDVKHIEDASSLMRDWLGPAASVLFGAALLAAGQSSTVTGTLAGQIVFEGFLRMRMKPWLRRIVTRVVAIVPAVMIIAVAGEDSVNQLLLYSQVVLSFQLPFAIIPLILFAFPKQSERLGQSEQKNGKVRNEFSTTTNNNNIVNTNIDKVTLIRPHVPAWANRGAVVTALKVSAWIIAAIIIALNLIFPILALME